MKIHKIALTLILFLLSCKSQITNNNDKPLAKRDSVLPKFTNASARDSLIISVSDEGGLHGINWKALIGTDSTKFSINYTPFLLSCPNDTAPHKISIKQLDSTVQGSYVFTFEDCTGNKSYDTIYMVAHTLVKPQEFSAVFFTLRRITEYFHEYYSDGQQKSFTQLGEYDDSAFSTFKIPYGYTDTLVFFNSRSAVGPYPSTSNYTIKVTIDWTKKLIQSFLYQSITGFSGHYSGYWKEEILIKDFPFEIKSDGSLSSFLSKDSLKNSIISYSHDYSGQSDIDGINATITMTRYSLDSLNSHFQFILK